MEINKNLAVNQSTKAAETSIIKSYKHTKIKDGEDKKTLPSGTPEGSLQEVDLEAKKEAEELEKLNEEEAALMHEYVKLQKSIQPKDILRCNEIEERLDEISHARAQFPGGSEAVNLQPDEDD